MDPYKLPRSVFGSGNKDSDGVIDLSDDAPVALAAPAARSAPPALDPRAAYRLYKSGLLTQPRAGGGAQGRILRPWEYQTEGTAVATMAPRDLLSLAEKRLRAVRAPDPAPVHDLVARTLDGIAWHIDGAVQARVSLLLQGHRLELLRDPP